MGHVVRMEKTVTWAFGGGGDEMRGAQRASGDRHESKLKLGFKISLMVPVFI